MTEWSMMVLDTNVLSALMNQNPAAVVAAWLDRQEKSAIWTTAVTVYEIRSGLDRMPEGRRRQLLEVEFSRLLLRDLWDRVLPFDRLAAIEAGRLGAARQRQGFTDDHRDIQIAGIVLVHGATLVTRNVRHFSGFGMTVANPWAVGPA